MSEVTKLVTMKRGQLIDVSHEGTTGAIIQAKIPVSEMIGWASDLRSATNGRGVSSLVDQLFEKVPNSLLPEVLKKIRQRKGIESEYIGA
jgi:elongation factor 2